MKIPQEFDTIRPWEPEDLPEVFDRLLSNDQFKQVLAYLYPQVPFEMIAQKLKACKTNLDFQLAFAYDFVHGILKNADQLAPALRVAFMESNEVMIEGFLDGTEISQGIYKTAEKTVVLPATEVVTSNEFFDYDAKYNGQVQEITPARLSPETAEEVAKTTSRIYDILHANGIIRIDYIISKDKDGKDKVNMLEINTTPGMTVTSFIPQQVRAAGLDIKDVLSASWRISSRIYKSHIWFCDFLAEPYILKGIY